MIQSRLPKRRFLLKIRRDKIQKKNLCVRAWVRACVYVTRVRRTLLILQIDSMLRRLIYWQLSGLTHYIPEVPASSLSLDSNYRNSRFS
jgi:hypothetical protein